MFSFLFYIRFFVVSLEGGAEVTRQERRLFVRARDSSRNGDAYVRNAAVQLPLIPQRGCGVGATLRKGLEAQLDPSSVLCRKKQS